VCIVQVDLPNFNLKGRKEGIKINAPKPKLIPSLARSRSTNFYYVPVKYFLEINILAADEWPTFKF
jgi:hypothetical protein